MVFLDVAGFALACVVMIKGGSYAVRSLTAIGKNLRIGGFLISFFLIGLVSALPEGFVASISAFQGVPNLGFGALIGSVIADLTLVVGLVAIAAGKIRIKQGFAYDLWLFFLMAMLFGMGADGQISRIDGLILIVGCLVFFYTMMRKSHLIDKLVHSDRRHLAKQFLLFAVSAAVVFISANFVVKYAQSIAVYFGLPLVVIGIILIALATSLPEAVFAITAATRKMGDVAIGELFGVIVIDGTLLIGLVAVISPITLPITELTKIAVFVLTAIALTVYFARADRVLTWKEGVFLILFYVLFIFTEITSAYLFGG